MSDNGLELRLAVDHRVWDERAAHSNLWAELAHRESQPAEVLLPGTARSLVETALASGLRLTRPPGLLLLSGGTDPPQALAISDYWLR
jgi:hypothetical protein